MNVWLMLCMAKRMLVISMGYMILPCHTQGQVSVKCHPTVENYHDPCLSGEIRSFFKALTPE